MGTTPVVVLLLAFLPLTAPPTGFSSPTMETSLLRIPDKSSSVYTFFGLAFSFSGFFSSRLPQLRFSSAPVAIVFAKRIAAKTARDAHATGQQPQLPARVRPEKPENPFAQRIALFHRKPHTGESNSNATPTSQDGQAESISLQRNVRL